MRSAYIIAFVFCLTALPCALGADPLDTLEDLVAQWLRLRRQCTQSATAWSAQKRDLDEELRVLKQRETSLARQLADLRRKGAEQDAEVAELRQIRDQHEDSLAQLAGPASRAEACWERKKSTLPDFLVAQLQEQLTEMRAERKDGPVDTEPVQRLAMSLQSLDVVALAGGRIHYGHHVVSCSDGRKRDMEVLLIGTGFALVVSPDDRFAGMGAVGEKGWDWVWKSEWAPKIRRAIQVHQEARPAALVPLPVRLPGGGV